MNNESTTENNLSQSCSWGIRYSAQGAKKERKGEEKWKKEEEEREIFQVLKKSLIFTKKKGEEKGKEIFNKAYRPNAHLSDILNQL